MGDEGEESGTGKGGDEAQGRREGDSCGGSKEKEVGGAKKERKIDEEVLVGRMKAMESEIRGLRVVEEGI